ncbi:MAG: hypothetical protein AAB291_00695 [Chloroflexota bacterium]
MVVLLGQRQGSPPELELAWQWVQGAVVLLGQRQGSPPGLG